MENEDLRNQIRYLEKKKAAFARNRNICSLVVVMLGYNFYETLKNDTAPVWYIFAMSLLIIASVGIGFYGHTTIKKIETSLAPLYKEELDQKEKIESDSE